MPGAQGKVLTVPLPGASYPSISLQPSRATPKRCFTVLNAALPWAALVLPHLRLFSLHNLLWLIAPSEPTETVSRGHWWPYSLAWPRAVGERRGQEAAQTPGFSLLAALEPSLHSWLALHALCHFLLIIFYFSTLKLHFLTEGLRPSEVTAWSISAHLTMVPLFTLFSPNLPRYFLHWMEENQALAPCSALPSLPFNNSPWEMSTSMNKDTN